MGKAMDTKKDVKKAPKLSTKEKKLKKKEKEGKKY